MGYAKVKLPDILSHLSLQFHLYSAVGEQYFHDYTKTVP